MAPSDIRIQFRTGVVGSLICAAAALALYLRATRGNEWVALLAFGLLTFAIWTLTQYLWRHFDQTFMSRTTQWASEEGAGELLKTPSGEPWMSYLIYRGGHIDLPVPRGELAKYAPAMIAGLTAKGIILCLPPRQGIAAFIPYSTLTSAPEVYEECGDIRVFTVLKVTARLPGLERPQVIELAIQAPLLTWLSQAIRFQLFPLIPLEEWETEIARRLPEALPER